MSTGFERIGSDSQLQDHWIRRLVAFIIDSVIVGLFTLVIAAIIWIPFILMAVATGLLGTYLTLFHSHSLQGSSASCTSLCLRHIMDQRLARKL